MCVHGAFEAHRTLFKDNTAAIAGGAFTSGGCYGTQKFYEVSFVDNSLTDPCSPGQSYGFGDCPDNAPAGWATDVVVEYGWPEYIFVNTVISNPMSPHMLWFHGQSIWKYNNQAIHFCSNNPCTQAPFTGTCTDSDDTQYGEEEFYVPVHKVVHQDKQW